VFLCLFFYILTAFVDSTRHGLELSTGSTQLQTAQQFNNIYSCHHFSAPVASVAAAAGSDVRTASASISSFGSHTPASKCTAQYASTSSTVDGINPPEWTSLDSLYRDVAWSAAAAARCYIPPFQSTMFQSTTSSIGSAYQHYHRQQRQQVHGHHQLYGRHHDMQQQQQQRSLAAASSFTTTPHHHRSPYNYTTLGETSLQLSQHQQRRQRRRQDELESDRCNSEVMSGLTQQPVGLVGSSAAVTMTTAADLLQSACSDSNSAAAVSKLRWAARAAVRDSQLAHHQQRQQLLVHNSESVDVCSPYLQSKSRTNRFCWVKLWK